MIPSASSSSIEEIVKKEVPDWNDELISTARFKAFSGQRKIELHANFAAKVHSSKVKNVWFVRGGLTPLCIDQVLQEMRNNGDLLSKGDLVDPTSGRLYQILRRANNILSKFGSLSVQENADDTLIIKTLLKERADAVIKTLADSNWTSICIITMKMLQNLCKDSTEASAILSYLCECGKARYLSIRKRDFIEGVKISLGTEVVSNLMSLDYHALHLNWTVEKLQQELGAIDQKWEGSRKLALASFKSGNKQAAYRHIKHSKLFSESRAKCASLLERVEEVLRVIADAESTKKVSEAIQIGAQAIKENRISLDEVYIHLQELDENISEQKQVDEALENMPLQSADFDDSDIEEEFIKLEMELTDENMPAPPTKKPEIHREEAKEKEDIEDSLSNAMSKLSHNPEAALS